MSLGSRILTAVNICTFRITHVDACQLLPRWKQFRSGCLQLGKRQQPGLVSQPHGERNRADRCEEPDPRSHGADCHRPRVRAALDLRVGKESVLPSLPKHDAAQDSHRGPPSQSRPLILGPGGLDRLVGEKCAARLEADGKTVCSGHMPLGCDGPIIRNRSPETEKQRTPEGVSGPTGSAEACPCGRAGWTSGAPGRLA